MNTIQETISEQMSICHFITTNILLTKNDNDGNKILVTNPYHDFAQICAQITHSKGGKIKRVRCESEIFPLTSITPKKVEIFVAKVRNYCQDNEGIFKDIQDIPKIITLVG